MFNNPLKKNKAASKATPQQEQQIMQMFQAASKNTGIDVETLMNATNQLQDDNQMKQYVEAISLAAQGDQNAITSLKKLFTQSQASAQVAKLGGKIMDFVCKHAKGGQITDCGCKEDGGKVTKAEDGNDGLELHPVQRKPNTVEIPWHVRLRGYLGLRPAQDVGNAKGRWTSSVNSGGKKYLLETANIGGTSADTWGVVTPGTSVFPADTAILQTVNGRINDLSTDQERTVKKRFSTIKEDGGVVKAQSGKQFQTMQVPPKDLLKTYDNSEYSITAKTYPNGTVEKIETVYPYRRIISIDPESGRQDTTMTVSQSPIVLSPYSKLGIKYGPGMMDSTGARVVTNRQSWKAFNSAIDEVRRKANIEAENAVRYADLREMLNTNKTYVPLNKK